MNWQFWKRRPNPLDVEGLRPLETLARGGDLKTAAEQLRKLRDKRGDTPALRYLEALVYHEGSAVEPTTLLTHLAPIVEASAPDPFPEARLLEARLLAAAGQLEPAAAKLGTLDARRLASSHQTEVRALQAAVRGLGGDDAVDRIADQADALASELRSFDLTIRWRLTDLARIDSLLDEIADRARQDRTRWTSLIGEIVVRALGGRWQLTPRPEDRVIELDGGTFPVGLALRDRLGRGLPLYAAAHRAAGAELHPLTAIPGVEVVVEKGAHLAVVTDHVARELLEAGAAGLGVFRERPTPDGPIRVPVSFVDKSDLAQVVYIETEEWDEARISALRRWLWRLRTSAARDAEVLLLSAYAAPDAVDELIAGSAGAPPVASALPDGRSRGARAATPRSLDEPRLRWVDERAEVMEHLVRSTIAGDSATDQQLVRKIQDSVLGKYRGPAHELSPKQWHGLYGYGALFGRILARTVSARWTGLGDDDQPSQWEMVLPDGSSLRPIGAVLKLAQLGTDDGDLVSQFIALSSTSRRTDSGDGSR